MIGAPTARLLTLALLSALALFAVTVVPPVSPAEAHSNHTNFTVDCGHGYYWLQYGRNRSGARSYAAVAHWEGYQWGGGCYNNNNIDDQPGDPPQQVSTNGEGPDCSGHVFRSWGMSLTMSSASQYYYYANSYQHGPYTASSFYYGNGQARVLSSKSYAATQNADAFASTGHIGIIYTEGSSNNTDTISEAKSESAGTGAWSRSYRGSSSYRAVAYRIW